MNSNYHNNRLGMRPVCNDANCLSEYTAYYYGDEDLDIAEGCYCEEHYELAVEHRTEDYAAEATILDLEQLYAELEEAEIDIAIAELYELD